MHRLLAALIALSLVSLQAQSLTFHTHAVADDHERAANHRHGPAIHHHIETSATDRHVGEADSSSDVITVAVPAATVLTQLVLHVESAAVLLNPPSHSAGRAPATITHSHDPPTRSHALFRGPPPPSRR